MKGKTSLILFVVFVHQIIKAQDNNDLSFFSNPVFVNPAYSGTKTDNKASYLNRFSAYRYLNFEHGTSVISGVSYDQYAHKLGGGIGIDYQKINHYGGFFNSDILKFNYSYFTKVNNSISLHSGVQLGIENRAFQYVRAGFPDFSKMDPIYFGYQQEPINQNSKVLPLLGLGCLIQGKSFNAGFSFSNLNQPNWSFYRNESIKKPLKIQGNAALFLLNKFRNNKVIKLDLISYYSIQNNYESVIVGLQGVYGKLTFDIAYNNNETYKIKQHIGFGTIGINTSKMIFKCGVQQVSLTRKDLYPFFSFNYLIKNKKQLHSTIFNLK